MNQQGFDASSGAETLSKLFAHFDRTKILDQETGKYHYEKYPSLTVRGSKRSVDYSDIDASRTQLNYNLAKDDQPLPQNEFFERRLGEIYVHKSALKNALVDWVITLPDMAQYAGREHEFFQVAYDAMAKKYGRENVVSAYVHLDEKQPHMHFVFVPVAKDNKHEQGFKLSRKAINTCERTVQDKKTGKLVVKKDTREFSKQAHEWLESCVCNAMGFNEAGVVLTEEQLKKRTIKQNMDSPQELKQAQDQLQNAESDIKKLTNQIATETERLEYLRQRAREVGEEVDGMRDTYTSIQSLEGKRGSEYRTACREIVARCDSTTAKINRGIEQLRERIDAIRQRINALKNKTVDCVMSLADRARQARDINDNQHYEHDYTWSRSRER